MTAAVTIKDVHTREFIPCSAEPEKEAWRDFIESYDSDPNRKYCLIVDSDLGALTRINKKETPIMDGFLLPNNWQLNYATSDVSDDFVMVRMMNRCERANKKGGKKA